MEKETIRYIVDAVEKANPQRTPANLNRRLHKFLEELGELSEAYLNASSINNGKGKTEDDVREEAVDTLIVAIDIALTETHPTNLIMKDQLLHLVQHVSLDHPNNYDDIITDVVKDFAAFSLHYKTDINIAKTDVIYLVKDAFVLVKHMYTMDFGTGEFVIDADIIADVHKKLVKWAASRNKVAEIDPEG
jgi:NTP pyrophosphatase (non-canonical NTP hydrolase)